MTHATKLEVAQALATVADEINGVKEWVDTIQQAAGKRTQALADRVMEQNEHLLLLAQHVARMQQQFSVLSGILHDIAASMTPEQIAAADRMAVMRAENFSGHAEKSA